MKRERTCVSPGRVAQKHPYRTDYWYLKMRNEKIYDLPVGGSAKQSDVWHAWSNSVFLTRRGVNSNGSSVPIVRFVDISVNPRGLTIDALLEQANPKSSTSPSWIGC